MFKNNVISRGIEMNQKNISHSKRVWRMTEFLSRYFVRQLVAAPSKQKGLVVEEMLDVKIILLVGGLMSYLCLFPHSGIQHIFCCSFFFVLCSICLPVSLDCPFFIAPSVFSNVYCFKTLSAIT